MFFSNSLYIIYLEIRTCTYRQGGANDGSGGAPAPPTTVGPMEPFLSPSYNFLPWMYCEERLKLSTGGNKPLLQIILDLPTGYACKRQGTTVSSTLQNILGTFSNSSAGQTVRGYDLHPECCMRKMDSILGHRIRSTRSANLSLQFSSMIILEAKQGDLSTAHKILKHHKISLNLDPNCF